MVTSSLNLDFVIFNRFLHSLSDGLDGQEGEPDGELAPPASDGPGRGSEFIVELPLAPDLDPFEVVSPGRATAPIPAQAIAQPGGKRILVVDDNEDAAESIADLLRDLGYEIETAYDGPAALRIAKVFKPEVCLVDIGLPAMDGYELARRLRESHDLASGARLIAVTGYGQDADRERSRQAGFDSHLVKPVNVDVLNNAVVN